MKNNSLSPPEKWILIGIPLLFLVGSLMHFLYELTDLYRIPRVGDAFTHALQH